MNWTSYDDQFSVRTDDGVRECISEYRTLGGELIKVRNNESGTVRVDTAKERVKGDVTLADVMVHSKRNTPRWMNVQNRSDKDSHYGRNHTRHSSPSLFKWSKGTNRALLHSKGYRILPIAVDYFDEQDLEFRYTQQGLANRFDRLPGLYDYSALKCPVPLRDGWNFYRGSEHWVFYPMKDGIINPNQRLKISYRYGGFIPHWGDLYDFILGVRNPYSGFTIQRPAYWIGC